MSELRRVERTEPAICPECGADTERLGQGAWSCTVETCPRCTEEYRRQRAVFRQLLESDSFKRLERLLNESREKFDRKLEAAGLAPTGAGVEFWRDLRAFGRYDLGLSDEEIGELDQGGLEAFLDRYLRKHGLKLPQRHDDETDWQAFKPDNWDPKPEIWRAFGEALLRNREATNIQLCQWVDLNKALPCKYAIHNGPRTWASALEDPARADKVHKLIGRVRDWLGIQGRVHGKVTIQ